MFFEAIGIPFPSETILISSGIEVTRGVFHFIPLWLSASLGNVLGSNIAYFIGRFVGRTALLKYGRYVKITDAKLRGVEKKFQKYQIPFIVIGKFIAFVRIVIPYLAGINKVVFWKFSIYNTLAAFGWSALFILLGHTIEQVWKQYSHTIIHYWFISAPIVVLIVIGGWWLHKKTGHFEEIDEKATL